MINRFRIIIKRIIFKFLFVFRRNNKTSIVFDACEKFHYFHVEPIIESLIDSDNFKITIVKWNNFNDADKLPGIKYITFNKFWHDWFSTYDILVTTELERKPDWFINGLSICMFHGAGPKMSYLKNPAINDYNVIFTVGPVIYNVLAAYVSNNTKIEKIGLPITDTLISTDSNINIPKGININKKNPSLLYAPSWSIDSNNVSMDNEILDALTHIKSYNVIIRPHPNLLQPSKCNGINWATKFNQLKKTGIQISLSEDHSAYELLPHIDILLGDISSITYEFLIFKRPIILYLKPGVLNYYDADDFIKPLNAATICLESANSLNNVLIDIHRKSNLQAQQDLLDDTLYNVGTATQKAVDAIIKYSKK